METFLEIIKYIMPALVVVLVVYLMLKSFFGSQKEQREIELRMLMKKEITPAKLQAYERLALMLERISIHQTIQRVRQADMTSQELQMFMIKNIREEFDHNLSQQIYVSKQVWGAVQMSRDETIKIINLVSASVRPDSPSLELSKRLLEYCMENPTALPGQRALDILKTEVSKTF